MSLNLKCLNIELRNGHSGSHLTSFRVIEVIEVEANECFAQEFSFAGGVLGDRETLHDDRHRVLEA